MNDLKETVGFEILPQESIFFRQDVKQNKKPPCKFDECWEPISLNSKSSYC
jgi:hypothetical protein